MSKSRLRLSWREAILLSIPVVLGVALSRIKAARDRAYIPFQNIVVPKSYRVGQTASALAFSPDSQRLAVADTQSQMWIWNLTQSKFERHFRHGSGDSVRSLSWSKHNLLVAGNTHAIRAFEVPKGVLKLETPVEWKNRSIQYQLDHYCQTAVSPRATLATLGQVHGAVSVWDTKSAERYFILKAPDRETCGLALSTDDTTLAVASLLIKADSSIAAPLFARQAGIEIALRDARTGRLQRTLRWDEADIERRIGFDGNLGDMGLAFSPDSKTLAGASTAGVAIWDVSSGRLLHRVGESNVPRWGGRKWVSFSPDGSLVAAAGGGEKIYVWSVKTGQELQVFHGSPSHAALTFSPDGKFLASGGQDRGGNGVVKVWDVQSLN